MSKDNNTHQKRKRKPYTNKNDLDSATPATKHRRKKHQKTRQKNKQRTKHIQKAGREADEQDETQDDDKKSC